MESANENGDDSFQSSRYIIDAKPRQKKKKKRRWRPLQDSVEEIAANPEALTVNIDQHFEYCEWDREALSPNMRLITNCLTSVCREVVKQSTDGARCLHGYQVGRQDFVFEFESRNWGSHCAVGLGRKECSLHRTGYGHLLGQDLLSWAFDIPSGQLFHNGLVVGSVGIVTKSDVGQNIRMKVDFEAGSLCFQITLDHNTRACMYSDPELCRPLHPLYPVISMVFGLAQCRVRKYRNQEAASNEIINLLPTTNVKETSDFLSQPGEGDSIKFKDCSEDALAGDRQTKESAEGGAADESVAGRSCDERARLPDGSHLMTSERTDISRLVVEPGEWNCAPEAASEESLLSISELPEDVQHQIVSYHGWDNVCRGGLIVPHPGAPSICVPVPRLSGGVQAIRCKQGFSSGRHRWKIRQLKSFKQVSSDNNNPEFNDILVGVASSEHSVYNYGYSLTNVGRQVWCYQRSTNRFRHGDASCILHEDFSQVFNEQDDLEVELNLNRHTLTFISNDKAFATITQLQGNSFYPFLIFHKSAFVPVQINYSKGPTEYVNKVMEVLENMVEQERVSIVFNYQPQLIRSSSPYLTDVASPVRMSGFHWGYASPGAKLRPQNLAQVALPLSQPVILVAETFLSGNVHRIQFAFDPVKTVDFFLGIVAEDFDADRFADDISLGIDRYLGDSTSSWGWNVSALKLFHASQNIATYHVFKDVNLTECGIFRMTISYNSLNCSSVGFEIVSRSSGCALDLGLAFVNIPSRVRPALMIHPSPAAANESKLLKVSMEYYSGAWIPAMAAESTSCTVL